MNLLIIEDNRFMSVKILIEFSECMKEKQCKTFSCFEFNLKFFFKTNTVKTTKESKH